jgi:hypothetical protein
LTELQDRLENNAVVQLVVDNFILSGLEPVLIVDPSVQTSLDFDGYNNGTTVDPAIFLPADLMIVEKMWERQTGSNLPFVPLHQPQEGLCSRNQWESFGEFELRGNAIWFPGATTPRDVRLRYKMREALIPAGADFTTIYIDLPGSLNTLAYMIAYRYVMSRNPETAPIVRLEVDRHIKEMIRRTTRQKQGIAYKRRPYGGNPNGGMRWWR